MRFSRVVIVSDCQCRSGNSPGFNPSIPRHSGIWGAVDESVLNIVHRRKKILKIPLFFFNFTSKKSKISYFFFKKVVFVYTVKKVPAATGSGPDLQHNLSCFISVKYQHQSHRFYVLFLFQSLERTPVGGKSGLQVLYVSILAIIENWQDYLYFCLILMAKFSYAGTCTVLLRKRGRSSSTSARSSAIFIEKGDVFS